MTRITVLGNFSGRNAGDNAILGNLVRDISAVVPDAKFIVPTLSVSSVRDICSGYDVEPLSLMPWHGAVKILGLSTVYAMLRTECVLITDNILFDKSFFNPLFNYLSTISLIAPFTRRRGIPIILYNASVGPIETSRGLEALRRVLKDSPIAILRDRSSVKLLAERLASNQELVLAADCALNTEPSAPPVVNALERQLNIKGTRPRLGLNVNSYVDAWLSGSDSGTRDKFITEIAASFDELLREFDAQPIFFVTQKMDLTMTKSVRDAMALGQDAPMAIVGAGCNYRELTGLLQRLDMLIAMRTHALILGTSVHTPAININSYPKSAAYMETIGQSAWNLDVGNFSRETLTGIAKRGWAARHSTRAALADLIPTEKAKAAGSARLIAELLRRRAVQATLRPSFSTLMAGGGERARPQNGILQRDR